MEIYIPYILPALIRIIGSLLVLKRPFWGFVFAIFLDAIDAELAIYLGNMIIENFAFNWTWYQVGDKILDTYMLALAVYMSRLWPERLARKASFFLFGLRLVGVILFTVTQTRWLLIVFPNIFELYYLFYAYVHWYKPMFRIKTRLRLFALLALLAVFQLAREYTLHIAQIPTWAYIKSAIRGFYYNIFKAAADKTGGPIFILMTQLRFWLKALFFK